MANENETIAEVCQKIRDAGIPDLADHIEAAWKREKSQSWHHREMEELVLRHEKEVAELKKQTGNSAAMREAVEAALTELDKFGQCNDARLHFADIVHVGNARGMLQNALLTWAQMPYESEVKQ